MLIANFITKEQIDKLTKQGLSFQEAMFYSHINTSIKDSEYISNGLLDKSISRFYGK